MGEGISVYRVSVERNEWKRPLERSRHRWVGGRITLRWISGGQGSMGQMRFGWLRKESNKELL
jgi:hypothetical protein